MRETGPPLAHVFSQKSASSKNIFSTRQFNYLFRGCNRVNLFHILHENNTFQNIFIPKLLMLNF